jgi:hypothetical protein
MNRTSKLILPGILIFAAVICLYGLLHIDDVVKWANANWKPAYLVYSVLVSAALIGGIYYFVERKKGEFSAQVAAGAWGLTAFGLLLFFFVGASHDKIEFLRLFGFGAAGAALGYLTGIWLAPFDTAEENRFAKAQSVVASVFAGAVGTKLLSLWDSLTSGNNPKILDPAYHLPVLSAVVSYLIGLAAFYTIRTMGDGGVRVTIRPRLVDWIGPDHKRNSTGVLEGTEVRFSAFADFIDDVSVTWDLKPGEHIEALVKDGQGAWDAKSGTLRVPSGTWISQNDKLKDWTVVATSSRDRSRNVETVIHFTMLSELPPS